MIASAGSIGGSEVLFWLVAVAVLLLIIYLLRRV